MYKTGDVLSIQYTGFKHYGIYIGNDTVIHNSKKFSKIQAIPLEDFKDGRMPKLSTIKSKKPSESASIAQKYLGLPYDLFSENCEHFVRVVCGLEKESTQVQKYLLSTIGVGTVLKSDNKVLKAAGSGVAIGAWLTPEEKSPIANSLVFGLLAAGVTSLVSER